MPKSKLIGILAVAVLLVGCANLSHKPDVIANEDLSDDFVTQIYEQRTWYPPEEVHIDPIGLGKRADIPINTARTKIIGPGYQDALDSLAAKLWMIENAKYTADLAYYIFKRDVVGYSILGALCNAVKRGVDVRIMVDSVGSIHPSHDELRALAICADDAGFIKNEFGRPTNKRARVQVIIINALSKLFVRWNRRAHDKLIVVDGHSPENAIVITGGRNISVSYYGIHEDGSPDPSAYQDVEIILRPSTHTKPERDTVGDVATYYFSLLSLHAGNKRLLLAPQNQRTFYDTETKKAEQSLSFVKSLPGIKSSLQKMPVYMNSNYRSSQVRLAHELGNLQNPNAIYGVQENLRRNPNSIQRFSEYLAESGKIKRQLYIVSPYYFMARNYNQDGEVVRDSVKDVYKWLDENPGSRIELITNSVLTSDNFIAQAVIDMDTAPRLLLPPELLERWLSSRKKGELDPQLVQSEEWKRLIDNPRIRIYQTGKLDSAYLGGDKHYGKLHAKFAIADGLGFVGTTNFDYRSLLFNNELGFYFKSDELYNDLDVLFQELKHNSYRWGTPEWLQMREQVIEKKGIKAMTTRNQRVIFKVIRGTGLEWLF